MRQLSALTAITVFLVAGGPISGAAYAQTLPQPPPYPSTAPPPPPHHYQPAMGQPQPQPPIERFALRTGWIAGFSISAADINLDDDVAAPGAADNSGAAVGLYFGGMVNPRLALMAELSAAFEQVDDADQSSLEQVNIGISAQYWARPRIWLRAGVATAKLDIKRKNTDETFELGKGAAALFAVGYEAVHRRHFAMDIMLRVALASYSDNSLIKGSGTVAAGLGFSWY